MENALFSKAYLQLHLKQLSEFDVLVAEYHECRKNTKTQYQQKISDCSDMIERAAIIKNYVSEIMELFFTVSDNKWKLKQKHKQEKQSFTSQSKDTI